MDKPPFRARLLWDGECWFCRLSVERLEAWVTDETGTHVEVVPYQRARDQFPKVPLEAFENSVQLFIPDPRGGEEPQRLEKAKAVFEVMAHAGKRHPLIRGLGRGLSLAHAHLPLFGLISDRSYSFVATHRSKFSRVSEALFGDSFSPSTYRVSDFLFRRGLFLVFLISLLSLQVQWRALFAESGIAPVRELFTQFEQIPGGWVGAWSALPSLFLLTGASDIALQLVLALGWAAALAGLLLPRRANAAWERAALGITTLVYLSWVNFGQPFFQFQWDALLLECGWLALLLPMARSRGDGRWSAVVFQLLLFKLIFLSGWVKLHGGDDSWSDLKALLYHFETQPLPTPIGVWMHGWSEPLLKALCALTLAVEFAVPFLIFSPRRTRALAFGVLSAMQVGFALTGNFGFFNLLSFLLGFYLVDDCTWRTWLPRFAVLRAVPLLPVALRPQFGIVRSMQLGAGVALSLLVFAPLLLRTGMTSSPVLAGVSAGLSGFHISNPYGLFSHMTTERRELVFEGSIDGKTWKEYQPRYRPGPVDRAPGWVAPHQPRFDWQLWFAVLGQYSDPQNRWVGMTLKRLLEGNPAVLALFRENPFPEGGPAQVRISVYRYRLADTRGPVENATVWNREWLGHYSPQIGNSVQAAK